MENDTIVDKSALHHHFQSVFQRLLSGEKIDLDRENIGFVFEMMATHLFSEMPDRKFHWSDGIIDLTARVRKSHQV